MPSFELGDELKQVQEAVQAFARTELREGLRAVESGGVSAGLQARFAELGLLGVDWPESAGGQAMGARARVVVEEALAEGDLGAAFALDRGGAASALLLAAGTPEAHAALMQLHEGGRLALAAAEEGKASEDFRTRATRKGSGWVVDGKKAYVLGGGEGGASHVVLAQVEPGKGLAGAGAFLVHKGGQGVRGGRTYASLGLGGVPLNEVVFESVTVPDGARLDAPGKLPALLRRFYDGLCLTTAARGVGLAAAAYEYARAYAEERTAFGKPIGHFQAIAFLLADMATAVDAARWLTWKAAWAYDTRGADHATAECVAAQAQALEAAFSCANQAVQVLGGAGYVQDHPVEKWMRDAKVLSLYGLHAQAAEATLSAAELGRSLTDDALFPLPSLHAALT